MRKTFVLMMLPALFILSSCTKENVLMQKPIEEIDFDTLHLERSMKGWELYSWEGDRTWNYALTPGTNRIKSYGEVVSSPLRVAGLNDLEKLLAGLPQGEEVIWIEEEWLKHIWEAPYYDLALPPDSLVTRVRLYSETIGIYLWVSDEY